MLICFAFSAISLPRVLSSCACALIWSAVKQVFLGIIVPSRDSLRQFAWLRFAHGERQLPLRTANAERKHPEGWQNENQSEEQGGWVINSVGFAGPNQRYTLAIMNGLNGQGGYDDGVATTTRLSQILLGPNG